MSPAGGAFIERPCAPSRIVAAPAERASFDRRADGAAHH